MRITADTNVLLRTLLRDNEDQAAAAETVLSRATSIAIPIPVLCELVWVLKRGYGHTDDRITEAIQAIRGIDAVVTDEAAVDAGLAALRGGADFADGAIACQGKQLGGAVFVSFDRAAVANLLASGAKAAEPHQLVR